MKRVKAARVTKTGLQGQMISGEPTSIFAAQGSSCCPEGCDCVANYGCRCDHDCVCPDKALVHGESMDQLIIPANVINKWCGNTVVVEKAAPGPPRPGLVPQSGDWEHPARWVRPNREVTPHQAAPNPFADKSIAELKAFVERHRNRPNLSAGLRQQLDDVLDELERREKTPKTAADFNKIAELQRGVPEQLGTSAFPREAIGMLQYFAEHIGDIIHRMTEPVATRFGTGGHEAVEPKVTRALRALTQGYGFSREVEEQLRDNYKHLTEKGEDLGSYDEFRQKVRDHMQRYADAYRKLPVYNEAQQYARDAAVSYGEGRYDETIKYLRQLANKLESTQTWAPYALANMINKGSGNTVGVDKQHGPLTDWPGHISRVTAPIEVSPEDVDQFNRKKDDGSVISFPLGAGNNTEGMLTEQELYGEPEDYDQLGDSSWTEGGLEKAAPGPPPRPGLRWKEETHRWVRPDALESEATSFTTDEVSPAENEKESYAGVPFDTWHDWAYYSHNINDADELRPGEMSDQGEVLDENDIADFKQAKQQIQQAASTHAVKSPTTYRGETFDSLDELKAKYPLRQWIATNNLTSTALEEDAALQYTEEGGPVKALVVIQNPNGIKGVQTAPLGVASNELVLPQGEKYRVARVHQRDDGVYQVDLYTSEKHRIKAIDPRAHLSDGIEKTMSAGGERGGDVLITSDEAHDYDSALRGVATSDIHKAVVPTPQKDEGGVAYDKVKTGDSIWITVSSPESPLHGRHVLITRRPDGLFAITGGMGPGVDERRHYVLTGNPHRSKRDEELEEEIDQVKEYNAPLEAAAREMRSEARKELQDASEQMLESLGLSRIDKDKMLQHKDDVQNYVADALGEDATSDKAKRITDAIMRSVVASERKVRERTQRERQVAVARLGKRLAALRETPAGASQSDTEMGQLAEDLEASVPDREPMSVPMPDVAALGDLSEDELNSAVANHFDRVANNYFEDDRPEYPGDDEDHGPALELGSSIQPLELKDRAALQSAVDNVSAYWQKRAEAEETSRALKKVPLATAVPSTLSSVRESAIKAIGPMGMAEIEERAGRNYESWLRTNTALAFYDAVGEYWNDDRALSDRLSDKDKADTVMQYHVQTGAATALAAIAQEHLGAKTDTLRLIQSGNIEMAAATVALEARQSIKSPEEYDRLIENVRQFNRTNQANTERLALERHATLDKQLQEIKRQQESGELVDRVRGASLELANLVEQRKNLGAALGSLQASATFFDRLEHFKTAKDDVVDISVGPNYKDAEAMVNRLGLKNNYVVDTSDPDNIRIRTGLSGMGRLVSHDKNLTDKHDRYEAIKTNMEGVEEDENGNLVVSSYDVPGWKASYKDAEGNTKPYKWRVEQRNDIEWLREATKKSEENPLGQGGGLITRVVGAGKTNATLGFYAHQLAENPNYKAVVAVPKGRAEQWVDEAKKFSDLNVVLIPEGSALSAVEDALTSAKPGTIVVTGHREAARAHETLAALQTHEDESLHYNGITIDEPQELQSRGQSGNVGAMGRRLMKVPFNHRIGLTATPARRLPTEAYDLIKWASGAKDLGSKAGFKRTFSGFGSGTNAQDSAISEAYFQTIQPYISGDRLTSPNFKTTQRRLDVKRTSEQVKEQKRIEAQSDEYINRRREELIAEARDNPNHALNRGPEGSRNRRARDIARKEVVAMHEANLSGGDWHHNAKLLDLHDKLTENPDQKHVVYIDSKTQRQSMVAMLSEMGYNQNQIKNIASTTTSITGSQMAARVRDFRENPNVNIIMIDRASASGYNLQQGDQLHVAGTPQDAANYLQAQGRVARMPRKGDVVINTYRYDDSPEEAAKWNDLDAQLKVLRASSPGMFSNL